jgi:branched-chain amino acid transport system substrate-binding protein
MGNGALVDLMRSQGLFFLRKELHLITGNATSKAKIQIGVLFSVTGPYSTVGSEMLNGTLLAMQEVNDSSEYDFQLVPSIENPGGDLTQYRAFCENLVKGKRIPHVVGCYTSISRKEVIPIIEKHDALLWYPSHYEGFESSSNVIYSGASPNQHIVPLAAYALGQYRPEVYCVGSNYIWAWENNRILREMVTTCGGRIIAEKYLPIGSVDVEDVIAEIANTKPGFIFNTLIGESSYALYRAYYREGAHNPRFDPSIMPITSCSLSEPELLSIGDPAAGGHITSSVYFQSVPNPENAKFVARYKAQFGRDRVTSADAEASYIATLLLAMAIRRAGTTDSQQVKKALYQCKLQAPQGVVWIDPDNNHCYLTPRLGRSIDNGRFSIFAVASAPAKPDPYLVWFDALEITADGRVRTEGEDEVGSLREPRRRHLRLVK